MRPRLLTAVLAVLVSGCLPAVGASDVVVSSDGTAAVTLTLRPSLPPEGRPRSVQDLRTDAEVMATSISAAAEDPGLCSRLRTAATSFRVEAGPESLTCFGTVQVDGEEFRPDVAGAAADLWDARRIVASAAAQVASLGYGEVPDRDFDDSEDLRVFEDSCVEGDEAACVSLYELSPSGSWSEVVALLGLRDDLVGSAPPAWRDLPLTVTQSITAPTQILDHNGEVSEDGRTVTWVFEVAEPDEVPANLFAAWSPAPAEDSGGVSALLLGVSALVLLAGLSYGGLVLVRRVLASRARRAAEPKVRRLSKQKKRKRL